MKAFIIFSLFLSMTNLLFVSEYAHSNEEVCIELNNATESESKENEMDEESFEFTSTTSKTESFLQSYNIPCANLDISDLIFHIDIPTPPPEV